MELLIPTVSDPTPAREWPVNGSWNAASSKGLLSQPIDDHRGVRALEVYGALRADRLPTPPSTPVLEGISNMYVLTIQQLVHAVIDQ